MIAMMVLVGSIAVTTRAQSIRHRQMNASIPFQFNVGDKTLPAGEYTVHQLNPGSDVATLQIRSKDGSNSAVVQMISATRFRQESARLIFRRYGNRYFFAQAWVDLENSGLEAPKSRAERAARSEMAGIKAKTETVALRNR